MSVFAMFRPVAFELPTHDAVAPKPSPKSDWPLMSDVATFRGDVPEALIRWRKARGETPPAQFGKCPTD